MTREYQPPVDGPRILPLRGRPHAALADLVARTVATTPGVAGVRLTCDVDPAIDVAEVAEPLGGLLAALVARACTAACRPDPHSDLPPLREVMITAVETGSDLEIEVADSGPVEPAAGVPAELVRLAGRTGATVSLRGCPEGGTAVTLRLPRRRVRGLAA